METVFLLIISVTLASMESILLKCFSMKFTDSGFERHVCNLVSCMVAVVILFCWGGIEDASGYTLFLGIAYGVVNTLQRITYLKAMELGALSYTMVIVNFSPLLTVLFCILVLRENLRWIQVVGMALMCVSVIFSVNPEEQGKKVTFKWIAYCMLGMALNGSFGIIQKLHQNSQFRVEQNALLIIGYAVSFVYSLIAAAAAGRKGVGKHKAVTESGWIAVMVLSGVCSALPAKCNLQLAGVMDGAVIFPVLSIGPLVLTTLASFAIFRERLSMKQWVGILLGSVAMLLCM